MSKLSGLLMGILLSMYTLYSVCIYSPANSFDLFGDLILIAVGILFLIYLSHKKSEGNSS
ncbi:hypothetical protein J2755_000362 [Methanohalophilus levihalophilus]|nr:hypothetical protein [Methanohalophilus levihalophilus]